MTMTADLSVVIVTYNSASDIERCLDSLPADNQELALDILVVDNASSDATLELIRARYPRVALTANEHGIWGGQQPGDAGMQLRADPSSESRYRSGAGRARNDDGIYERARGMRMLWPDAGG